MENVNSETLQDLRDFFSDAYKDEYGFRPRYVPSDEELVRYFDGREERVAAAQRREELDWLACVEPAFKHRQWRRFGRNALVTELGGVMYWVKFYPTYMKGGTVEYINDGVTVADVGAVLVQNKEYVADFMCAVRYYAGPEQVDAVRAAFEYRI